MNFTFRQDYLEMNSHKKAGPRTITEMLEYQPDVFNRMKEKDRKRLGPRVLQLVVFACSGPMYFARLCTGCLYVFFHCFCCVCVCVRVFSGALRSAKVPLR